MITRFDAGIIVTIRHFSDAWYNIVGACFSRALGVHLLRRRVTGLQVASHHSQSPNTMTSFLFVKPLTPLLVSVGVTRDCLLGPTFLHTFS
jgi:hypothetical protein